jgi:hypothetical protein
MKGGREALRTGSVIVYPYLWRRQADRGETEGRKDRPTAVVVRLASASASRVFLLAITSREPDRQTRSVEIPENERRRAGLSVDLRLWIIIDEMNVDVPGRSYYLRPQSPMGSFSDQFFLPILRKIVADRSIKIVKRT